MKSRKYNLIVDKAKFDNIVLMSDFILLDNNWYKGLQKYCKSNTFDFLSNKIYYKDKRALDWISATERENNRNGLEYGALVPYNINCMKAIQEYMIYFNSRFFKNFLSLFDNA